MYSFCLSLFLSKWESMTETQQICVARESNFLSKLKLTSGHFTQMISGVWSASFPPFDDANLANLHHTVDSRDLNSGNKTRLWKTQDLYHYYLIIRWQSNIGPGSNSSFIASKGYLIRMSSSCSGNKYLNSMFSQDVTCFFHVTKKCVHANVLFVLIFSLFVLWGWDLVLVIRGGLF